MKKPFVSSKHSEMDRIQRLMDKAHEEGRRKRMKRVVAYLRRRRERDEMKKQTSFDF